YVVVLWLLSGLVRGRGTPPSQPGQTESLPLVTLIVPAFNEEVVLEAKLKNSLEIDYPRERLEILVASDGSRDQTNEIASRFADQGVRLLAFEENRGKASAMNDAVREARGELLCLCDANVMFRPDALRILVEKLRDPAVGAATGDVRLLSADSEFGEGESLYYRIERRIQEYESALGSTMGVDGGMYVIRKELYRALPRDTVLDDFKTSMNVVKANRRLIYEPSAVAIENGTPLSSDEFRRRVRVAAGAAQSVKRGDFPPPWHPFNFFAWFSHKFLRWTGPIWLVVLLATTIALWNEGWIYRVALGCQLLVYGLTLIAWVWPALRTSRVAGVAFYFTLSHLAIAWGTIKGLFLMQSGTWKRTARTPIPGSGSPTAN
ncbi:MAG: glycosyltransferase family 2 protein, partial [Planctomycetaceae bacterium]